MTKVHATALTHERALSIVQEVHQGKGYDWSLFQYKGAREKVTALLVRICLTFYRCAFCLRTYTKVQYLSLT